MFHGRTKEPLKSNFSSTPMLFFRKLSFMISYFDINNIHFRIPSFWNELNYFAKKKNSNGLLNMILQLTQYRFSKLETLRKAALLSKKVKTYIERGFSFLSENSLNKLNFSIVLQLFSCLRDCLVYFLKEKVRKISSFSNPNKLIWLRMHFVRNSESSCSLFPLICQSNAGWTEKKKFKSPYPYPAPRF